MAYYLRRMCKEDIEQVTDIDREAFPTQWPPPNYLNELRNQTAHYCVVCDEEKIATTENSAPAKGFISGLKRLFDRNRSSDQVPPSNDEYIIGFIGCWIMADEAHITSIAVREAYRRQGIGEMLIISAVELAMKLKASILTLEVRVSNTGAQMLYSKYGFTQVGVRRGYYTDNREDALIMSTDKITSESFQARFQQLKEAYSKRRAITAKTILPE
ncbi:MAG: ribosomal protein S18-alanine N-acetyltransferase [Chloroflexi bacterium]|nr:ribosomal protein S18-alanine N-acetyltransferase [Chloroflexota bacterium]